ncbi:hypothetical protein KKE19_03665 [Patescibacteria group bacterium]|nr:hypothetical protein [Patescibacteria group bacterium]MCG2699792.1 hypothetical protein [Candidatus Parcubacteria bacterium]
MNNKILIVSICAIIGGVVLLGVGYLVGVGLEKDKTGPQLEKLEKAANILNSLSSLKIIASTIAFGEVTKISDRTITLTYGTENLPIRIKEDAKISSFILPAPNDKGEQIISDIPEQKTAEFGDIKVGDNLNISLRILPDGEIEGISVIIFSPFNTAR